MAHHPGNLRRQIPAVLKILAHPVFQPDSFAYIDNFIPFIVHQIDAGFRRKLL